MSTKDVAKYLVENGYNIELIKNINLLKLSTNNMMTIIL